MAEPRRALVRRRAHLPQAPPRQRTDSVNELNADIEDWIEHWNENPNPDLWTKTAEEILDNLAGYRNTVDDSRH